MASPDRAELFRNAVAFLGDPNVSNYSTLKRFLIFELPFRHNPLRLYSVYSSLKRKGSRRLKLKKPFDRRLLDKAMCNLIFSLIITMAHRHLALLHGLP